MVIQEQKNIKATLVKFAAFIAVVSLMVWFYIKEETSNSFLSFSKAELNKGYVGLVVGKDLPDRNKKIYIKTSQNHYIGYGAFISECFYNNTFTGDTVLKRKGSNTVTIIKPNGKKVICDLVYD